MAKLTGKGCRITVGSAHFAASRFSADPTVAALDAMTFESGGFGEYQAGAADCPVSMTILYDDSADLTAGTGAGDRAVRNDLMGMGGVDF